MGSGMGPNGTGSGMGPQGKKLFIFHILLIELNYK